MRLYANLEASRMMIGIEYCPFTHKIMFASHVQIGNIFQMKKNMKSMEIQVCHHMNNILSERITVNSFFELNNIKMNKADRAIKDKKGCLLL